MWLFLNDSFLSIVAHREEADALLVRARRAGDIEAVFRDVPVLEQGGTDYRFRATVPAAEVAQAVAGRVRAIDYGNFKDSVPDRARHDAYLRVWDVMRRWGQGAF